jgi:hypothetical protein
MTSLRVVMLIGLVGWLCCPALASPIQIDPGAYTYPYSVDGAAPVAGPRTVDLAPGTHWIELGPELDLPGIGSSAFLFEVDDAGQVTAITDPVTGQPSSAAQGVGAQLVFNTATVTIEPGGYRGHYRLQHTDPALEGTQAVVLVPGLLHSVEDATVAPAFGADPAGFYVQLDATGQVAAVLLATGAPSVAAVGSGTTLHFNR